MLRKERLKREQAMSVWSTVGLVPSAFSPAFSSCSLTTSFMCCHWGSPSPISWTLTSPLGLLPVLYLVILILTWSSAAWSGLTRQKRDKHHSWPHSQGASLWFLHPVSRATAQRNHKPKPECVLQRQHLWSATVFGPFQWFRWLCFRGIPFDLLSSKSFDGSIDFSWRCEQMWVKGQQSERHLLRKPGNGSGGNGSGGKLWSSGYLAVLDAGCGCSCANCWLVDFLCSDALAPAHLSPPIDRAACQAWSPAPVLLECGQTPL